MKEHIDAFYGFCGNNFCSNLRGLSGAYLPQFDTHDHPQLSVWYQGADWGLTRKLNNLDLQRTRDKQILKTQ